MVNSNSLGYISFLLGTISENVPLEGIKSIRIISNGDKTILILGEVHKTINFKSGCTPILAFLQKLFNKNKLQKYNFNIDFLMEAVTNPLLQKDLVILHKKLVTPHKYINPNSGQFDWEPSKPDYLKYKRGHITKINMNDKQIQQVESWIEPCLMNRLLLNKSSTDAELAEYKIMYEFLYNRVCFKNVHYHWLDELRGTDKSLLNVYLSAYLRQVSDDTDMPSYIHWKDDYAIKYMKNNPKDRMDGPDDFIKILINNERIKKEAKKSNIKMDFFIIQYQHFILDRTRADWGGPKIIFNIIRFCMDVYTFCRIMKNEKSWYKNMISYSGNWHATNLTIMLLSWDPIFHIVNNKNIISKFEDFDFHFNIQNKCYKII